MNPFANIESERILLASMLAYPEAYHQALALGITAGDFSVVDNRVIAAAMIQVGRRGEPVQFETVLAELATSSDGDKYRALLTDVADQMSMPRRNIEWHTRQVKDKARRRSLVAACERGIEAAEDGSENADDCVGYV